ncbi:MAG: hypothetical protein HZA53_00860 [Planctomycetes bacterium]|nr:hypothetical protein [Planctomycetota bacterium]
MQTPSHLARFTALALALVSIELLTAFDRPARTIAPRRGPPSRLTSGTGGASQPAIAQRLLYVWDNTLPGDATRTGRLLEFCPRGGIGTIAIDCAPLGVAPAAHAARYRAFVDQARGRGLRVLALAGDSWWTAPASPPVPNQQGSQNDGWNFYGALRSSGVAFDGVLDVSEPYLRDPAAFWANPLPFAQGLVDFLAGARARLGSMPLLHAMPYWYDEDARLVLRLAGSSIARPLNQYVQPLVDTTVLLENRDHALGTDGILAHSQGELATGPCILGVETQDLGTSGNALTFWEEGRAAMERQLALVTFARLNNPNLRGFAIHHYASFVNLAP